MFRQGNQYGIIDPVETDPDGTLHINWWLGEPNLVDFSVAEILPTATPLPTLRPTPTLQPTIEDLAGGSPEAFAAAFREAVAGSKFRPTSEFAAAA